MSTWTAIALTALGCALLKALGWAVPSRLLDDPRVRRAATVLPVALLAGLVVVQTVAAGRTVQLDARLAGLAVAALALLLRAPFLVVVLAAAATAAGLRALSG